MTDGFRDPRAYTGIHSETLAGSFVLVIRHLTGAALELVPSAGAAYVDVAIGVVVLNAAVGIFFLLGGAWLGWSSTNRDLVRTLGVVTAGIMLASPLLSAQFVYWLIPFAIFFANERSRLITILVGVLTLLVVVAWSPTDAWWAGLTLGRNLALVALAATWLTTVAGAGQRPAASTSRKNLPV